MNKSLLYFLMILWLYLLGQPVRSQQITFQKVTSPTGNFSNLVGGMAQDKNGYLWIATSNGLYRYDGYRFKLFAHDPTNPNSPGENKLETVYADRNGIIWIATWTNGLDRLDPVTNTFTHYRHQPNNPASLSDNNVRTILEDREGILWFGTNGGLDRFDPKTGKFKNYQHDPNDPTSLSCNRVRKLYEDRSGILWVGTGSVWNSDEGDPDEGGLNRLNQKTGQFTRYLHDPANSQTLINNKVQAICEDSRGNFWVGTAGDGLHTLNRTTGIFKRYSYDPAHPEKLSRPPLKNTFGTDQITFITEDDLGNIWVGTLGNGLVRHDAKKGTTYHYTNKDTAAGFTDISPWSFCNSRDGILWVGTFQGSLFRVDPYQKNIPQVSIGSMVTAICDDPVNGTWIGTPEGLLLRNQATGIFKKFSSNPLSSTSISHDYITSLFRDEEGVLWIGTANGLNRLNSQNLNFTRYQNNPKQKKSIDTGTIYALADAGNNFLWVGTGSGLDLMNKKTGVFTHFRHNPAAPRSLTQNPVSTLLQDKTNNLWVGAFTGGGLNYLNQSTKTFQHFLPGHTIYSLHRAASGILWVGTQNSGLYRSTDAAAKEFMKINGLDSSLENITVSSIQEDSQQQIWINANTGIYKINPQTNQATVFSPNYGISTGYQLLYGGYQNKGKIYFGNLNGYHVFLPDDLITNPHPPQVILTDFRIGGRSVRPGPGSPLTESLEQVKNINLPHNQNVIALDFAGIHFSSPENNRHLYQLENYDPEWREAGAEKTAYYFNVPPGHYQFKVKAASSEGSWAERAITIIISPPWWRTWWAYGVYVLLFLGGGYAAQRYQRQRILTAEQERARVRELKHAKEIEKAYTELKATQQQLIQKEKMASLGELTAGIAHEIQNPLNFVNNFSEVSTELLDELAEELTKGDTKEALNIAGDIKENLKKINHHGKRADNIVKGMLQHSRTSTGEKQLADINALAEEYLRLSYHGLRAKNKDFNANLVTDFDRNISKVEVVPQELGRVLLNLFNNAFYATQQKKSQLNGQYQPEVKISTSQQDGKLEIRIRDNGTGIPISVKNKIFQPFFTTKPTGQGTGLGLSLSYDIITKGYGGELAVKTEEGEYTEFIINLPQTAKLF